MTWIVPCSCSLHSKSWWPLTLLVAVSSLCYCIQLCLTQEPVDYSSVQVREWVHRNRSLVIKKKSKMEKRPVVKGKGIVREQYPFRERPLDWPLFLITIHIKGAVIDDPQKSWFWGSWAQNGLQVNCSIWQISLVWGQFIIIDLQIWASC